MTSYYNEIDRDAVAVLEEFIRCGFIAPGIVDSRSIKDVTANDLKGFTQVHLFAGAGMWSVAARLGGWPDNRPVWTVSCPCQGESLAGKRLGADDPRHLWPDVYRILGGAIAGGFAPPVIVGEQVAAAAGTHWLDGVCADLARKNYPARAVDIPTCAVDAPHQRQRLWWLALADAEGSARRPGLSETGGGQRIEPAGGDVANAEGERGRRDEPQRGPEGRTAHGRADAGSGGRDGEMEHADSDTQRVGTAAADRDRAPSGEPDGGDRREGNVDHAGGAGRQGLGGHVDGGRKSGRRSDPDAGAGKETPAPRPVAAPDDRDGGGALVDAACERRGEGRAEAGILGRGPATAGANVREQQHRPNGSWYADAEWIICHDGKARRAKPSIPNVAHGVSRGNDCSNSKSGGRPQSEKVDYRMLVHGMPGRIAAWSLAGNAINPQLAAKIFAALLDAEDEARLQNLRG